MIRAPFVVEGMLIGFIGGLLPNILVLSSYKYIMELVVKKAGFITNILKPLPLQSFAYTMVFVSIVIPVFVCMIVSYFTIRKQVRV